MKTNDHALHHVSNSTPPAYEQIINRQPDYFEQALTVKEVASFLDTTTPALAQMRGRGTGPKYIRLPTATAKDSRDRPRGPIRYIRRNVIEWLHERRQWSNTMEEVA